MLPKYMISVSTVILNDSGKILLIKGAKRGWELPGGLLEYNETIIDALTREVREETGVEIHNIRYRGLFHNIIEKILNLLFIADYKEGELTTSEESLDVKFFSFEEANEIVTWTNFADRIKNVLYATQPFWVEF